MQNVKNTIQRRLTNLLAPHHCYGCGQTGTPLCEYCRNNIIEEPYFRCIVCEQPYGISTQRCATCRSSFARVWCVGERHETLERLINAYKFERCSSLRTLLAELLNETMPQLPPDITVVPVPTISAHIRRRGYDHAAGIAKRVAQSQAVPYRAVLQRQHNHVQHGASRKDRIRQAKTAFRCTEPLQGRYILIDDVYTTGSTVEYASRALLEAGASEVWVAVLCRQSLAK